MMVGGFVNSVFTRFCLVLLSALTIGVSPAVAGDMVYIHSQGETAQDHRQDFSWQVLRQALERTRASYGAFTIKTAPVALRQQRLLQALDQGNREVNIALLPVMPDSARHGVFPVRIPVLGGLWSYRVLLVPADRQGRFDSIRTLEDLKQIAIGQAWYWADTTILQDAGLQVVKGDTYDGLFKMLAAGRFDAFNRSVVEVRGEYDALGDMAAKLAIERRLLLHYPMPEYFWFSDDPAGRRLAQRVETGLASMVADHSLCRMVEERFGKALNSLSLDSRIVIEIANPLVGPEDHLDEPAYWCNPLPAGEPHAGLHQGSEKK